MIFCLEFLQQKSGCVNVLLLFFFFSGVFNSGVKKKEKCLVQSQQDFLLDLAMVNRIWYIHCFISMSDQCHTTHLLNSLYKLLIFVPWNINYKWYQYLIGSGVVFGFGIIGGKRIEEKIYNDNESNPGTKIILLHLFHL